MESQHAAIGVHEGEILAGKYRIERVLGAGGMGVVVAARHIELDERVAIKFLLPETLDNPEVVARFSREARAAVRIKSEHVARIIDVGRMESGAPYIVMEYLEGVDLASWLQQRGPLPVDQALDFVLQACEAIAAAHALGIIHRDLKPANLFVVRLGDGRQRVKVLDFGISKVLTADQSAPSITNTAALLGSPLYMPPEQMRSARNVDTRSDIWSLGVILHELIAGKPPFAGITMPEVLTSVLEGTPPGLRTLVPSVPEALESIVLRCLQKDKTLRFADVGELSSALATVAPARSRAAADRIARVLRGPADSTDEREAQSVPPAPEALPGMRTRASWGGTHAGARSPRLLVGLGAGAVITTAVVASVALWGKRGLVEAEPVASVAAPADVSSPVPPSAPLPSPAISPVTGLVSGTAADAAPEPAASASRRTRDEAAAKNVRPRSGRVSDVRPAPAATASSAPPVQKAPRANADPFEDR